MVVAYDSANASSLSFITITTCIEVPVFLLDRACTLLAFGFLFLFLFLYSFFSYLLSFLEAIVAHDPENASSLVYNTLLELFLRQTVRLKRSREKEERREAFVCLFVLVLLKHLSFLVAPLPPPPPLSYNNTLLEFAMFLLCFCCFLLLFVVVVLIRRMDQSAPSFLLLLLSLTSPSLRCSLGLSLFLSPLCCLLLLSCLVGWIDQSFSSSLFFLTLSFSYFHTSSFPSFFSSSSVVIIIVVTSKCETNVELTVFASCKQRR